MVILFLMYAVDLVAEHFEMVTQDIIYIRCRGQSLAADFFQDFKDFPFRRGTDIERGAEVVIHPDKKCFFVVGQCHRTSPSYIRDWSTLRLHILPFGYDRFGGLRIGIGGIFRYGDNGCRRIGYGFPNDICRRWSLSANHLPNEFFVDPDIEFRCHRYRILSIDRISSANASICASWAKERSGAKSVERPTPVPSGSSSLLNFERYGICVCSNDKPS